MTTVDNYRDNPNTLATTSAGVSSSLSWDTAVSSAESDIKSGCGGNEDKIIGNSNDCPAGYSVSATLGAKT